MLIKEGGTQAEAGIMEVSPLPNTPFPFLLQPLSFPPLLLIHKALGEDYRPRSSQSWQHIPHWPQ